MADQLTTSAEALRLFFTDDVYLVKTEEDAAIPASPEPQPGRPAEVQPVLSTVSPAVEMKGVPPADIMFKYLGKNQKNVLILVYDAENDVSSEGGRELLRNLVKAMQLTANDFALLNYFNYEHAKFEHLNSFFNSKLVLGFGVSPAQLGLNEQPQHTISMFGAVQLVFSGRLDQLVADQEGKKKLWASLKQLTF
jgi:hypothetical protein